MRAASTTSAIGLALWIAASSSQAVGFGRVSNSTQIGQPLNFAAVVNLEPDEQLARECVSAEVQSGDNKLQPQLVRATLEPGTGSERRVRVTTSALIDEPVVTVSVTLGCNSKVTRRFVAFVDPPLIDIPRTADTEPTPPPQRVDSQVSPILSIVQGSEGGAPAPRDLAPSATTRLQPRLRAVAASPSEPRLDEVAAPRPPRRQAAASHRAHVARAAASGPRLQLDPAPVAALAAAAPPSASPTGAPSAFPAPSVPPAVAINAAAPAGDPASATGAGVSPESNPKDHQRIQALEDSVAKMRGDTQATQAALATLQLRLQQAESERYANPMVYALAWLVALLAVASAVLWWRQSRGRSGAQWWAGPAPIPAPSDVRLAPLTEPVVAAVTQPAPSVAVPDAFATPTVVDDAEEPPAHVSLSTRPAPFVSSMLSPITLSPEPPRELSVEELIDLEQQAEFFVVLGQDDAAIELLMNHVRSDGGISPLPYLKLLEIYRRLGDRDAYHRIRERFNRRFNAYAPDWESDLQQGRTLLDYPDTLARLQGLWSAPGRVMETLDASLFRRNHTDETFDLPAYRELLFLYSVARDLAEHDGVAPTARVDVLLPLGDLGEEPIARLSATTQPGDFQTSDMMTLPVDLDVSFGEPLRNQDMATRPTTPYRPPEAPAALDSNFIDFDLDVPYPLPHPKAGKS